MNSVKPVCMYVCMYVAVQTDRFYCSLNDWFEIASDPGTPTISVVAFQPISASLLHSPATDDQCKYLYILLVVSVCALIIVVGLSLMLALLYCRRNPSEFCGIRFERAPAMTEEGVNELFMK